MSKSICDTELPWCTPKAKAGEFHKLRIDDLSPTQFAAGRSEVMVKAGLITRNTKKTLSREMKMWLNPGVTTILSVWASGT